MSKFSAKDLTYVAMSVALIAVCSWISVPMTIPFTLQTFAGTAKLALETGKDPAELRAAVCSPGGSTIEGVAALEKDGARYAMLEVVAAAYKRTKELG